MSKIKLTPIKLESPVGESIEVFHSLKILALVNENSPTAPALEYLRKRGHRLEIRNNLMEGVHQLSLFKPDILLLSWNLKNTDIKRVYPIITSKFNTLCFIIGEDNNNQTTTQLMSSGIPNIVYPPVGGINLFSRIKSAIEIAIETVSTAQRIDKGQISKGAQWNIRLHADKPYDQIWEAVNSKPESTTATAEYLYYKGENPQHDLFTENPSTTKALSEVLAFDKPASQEVLLLISKRGDENEKPSASIKGPSWQFSMKPNVENLAPSIDGEFVKQIEAAMSYKGEEPIIEQSDVTQSNAIISSSSSHVVNGQSVTETHSVETRLGRPKNENQLLEVGMQTAIILALESEFENFDGPILIDQVSQFSVSIIKSQKFNGYLISGQSNDLTNPELMKKVFENLQNEMQKHGESLSILGACLELELKPISFKELAKHQAEFVMNSRQGSNEISFAYLPVETLPPAFANEEITSIERHFFIENRTLLFDVYLHLPKNQKYVYFLKRGASFSSDATRRLDGFGIKKLSIKKADEKLFYSYCVRNHIERDGPISPPANA